MLILRGAPALSDFRLGKLEQRLAARLDRPIGLYAEFVHFADTEQKLGPAEYALGKVDMEAIVPVPGIEES